MIFTVLYHFTTEIREGLNTSTVVKTNINKIKWSSNDFVLFITHPSLSLFLWWRVISTHTQTFTQVTVLITHLLITYAGGLRERERQVCNILIPVHYKLNNWQEKTNTAWGKTLRARFKATWNHSEGKNMSQARMLTVNRPTKNRPEG